MTNEAFIIVGAVIVEAHLATAVIFILKMYVRQRITETRVRHIYNHLGINGDIDND